jgi:hypothetical protein
MRVKVLNQKINELNTRADANMHHARIIEDFFNYPESRETIAIYAESESINSESIKSKTIKTFTEHFNFSKHTLYFDPRINAAICLSDQAGDEIITLIYANSVMTGVSRKEQEGFKRLGNLSQEELLKHFEKVGEQLRKTETLKQKLSRYWPF